MLLWLWLWLWHRPAAVAPIGPLDWELPFAASVALKKEKILDMISVFLNLLRPVFWPSMCYILENVPCVPKRMYSASSR